MSGPTDNDALNGQAMDEASWLAAQPPPALPQGTTGLPDRSDIDPTWRAEKLPGLNLTVEQMAIGDAWQHLMFTDSELLGRPITNYLDICEHVALLNAGAAPVQQTGKRGRPRKSVDTNELQAREAKRVAYVEWVKLCTERKDKINAAKAELAARKRAKALALAEFEKYWSAHLGEVASALEYWESLPVPPRP